MKKQIKLSAIVIVTVAFSLSLNAQNTFPSSGNAGVGTITPADKLHIHDFGGGILRLTHTNTSYLTSQTVNTGIIRNIALQWNNNYTGTNVNETSAIKFGYYADPNGRINNAAIRFYTQADFSGLTQERMSIVAGNVGINAPVPTEKLSVAGNILAGGSILWGNTVTNPSNSLSSDQGGGIELGAKNNSINPITNGTPYIDFHYGTGTAQDYNIRIINTANNRLDFAQSSSATIMTMIENRVGIGTITPNPSYKLDVAGPVNATQYLVNGVPLGQWQISGNNVYYNSGNVAIGTDNAHIPVGVKLAVCGKVQAKEIVVDASSWCDFVFDPAYDRMNWKEKERFFAKNKHMFGVDPENEITKNGLQIAKNLKGVVQNVEENSLDIIDLYKMIEELKMENEKLKAMIVVLEKK